MHIGKRGPANLSPNCFIHSVSPNELVLITIVEKLKLSWGEPVLLTPAIMKPLSGVWHILKPRLGLYVLLHCRRGASETAFREGTEATSTNVIRGANMSVSFNSAFSIYK